MSRYSAASSIRPDLPGARQVAASSLAGDEVRAVAALELEGDVVGGAAAVGEGVVDGVADLPGPRVGPRRHDPGAADGVPELLVLAEAAARGLEGRGQARPRAARVGGDRGQV